MVERTCSLFRRKALALVALAAALLCCGYLGVHLMRTSQRKSIVFEASSERGNTAASNLRIGVDNTNTEPLILVLSPMKNALKHLPTFFSNLRSLTYPNRLISVGILESDSDDSNLQVPVEYDGREFNSTWGLLQYAGAQLTQFRHVRIMKHDFKFSLPRSQRHEYPYQLARRSILAKSRNLLLSKTLRDEDYVLWVDSDLLSYPADIIQQLLSVNKDIVVPNCVMKPGGRTYDLNSWRHLGTSSAAYIAAEQQLLHSFTEHVSHAMSQAGLTRHSKVSALVSVCSAALHAAAPGINITAAAKAEVKHMLQNNFINTLEFLTYIPFQRFDFMQIPAGYHICVKEVTRQLHSQLNGPYEKQDCKPSWNNGLFLQGYDPTRTAKYLHHFRGAGSAVRLDAIGGTMILVRADVHREGLVFPPYAYRGYIETEGLSFMARDMGYESFGMPNVEIIHP